MSVEAAAAFLERLAGDAEFAREIADVRDEGGDVIARVRALGYHVTPGDLRQAWLDRNGAALNADELDGLAGGADATLAVLVAQPPTTFDALVAHLLSGHV